MLFRWDLESGVLFGVESRFLVWQDGIDTIPAIRFDCPLSQRGIAPGGRRLVPLPAFLDGVNDLKRSIERLMGDSVESLAAAE